MTVHLASSYVLLLPRGLVSLATSRVLNCELYDWKTSLSIYHLKKPQGPQQGDGKHLLPKVNP